jgi:anaerobic magnesium-protoporphyrin IX monomethyl ester cyclase
MRVALVHPPPASEFDKHWARFPVLGLAYVASSLRGAGHQVTLLDGKLARLTVAEIVDRIVADPPDLVGITCMTVEYPMAARIAAGVKARHDVPIVVGGAHVNAVSAQALEECDHFDFGCVGEGEWVVNELLESLAGGRAIGDVPGLLHRREGRVAFNGSRPYPKDYDALPFPAWDLFALGDQVPVLTHRGCPFQCNFCGHNSGFTARFRTPENVLEEIGQVIERHRPRVVRFEDETFGLNLRRTKAILAGIIERGYHRRVRFSAQTRVDRIDEEFIDLLKEANFETLELGVESGNPVILKATRKMITLEQVEHAVHLARSRRLRVWCKFILGHPYEDVHTVRDTVDFIARINPDQLSVAIMTPFPGTPIHAMAVRGEGGYRLMQKGWGSYDKYSSGVLELDGISLGRLKFYQIWAYVNLYLKNRRLGDALRLVASHRSMAVEMVLGWMRQILRERTARLRGGAPTPTPGHA